MLRIRLYNVQISFQNIVWEIDVRTVLNRRQMFKFLDSGFTINLVAFQTNSTILCANIHIVQMSKLVVWIQNLLTPFCYEKIGQTMRYKRFNSCVFLITCWETPSAVALIYSYFRNLPLTMSGKTSLIVRKEQSNWSYLNLR